MAIGFRAQTNIASGGATDPTSAPALPTGTASGDMVVYGVIVKYASTTIATNPPTSWQDPSDNEAANSGLTDSGNDAGNIRCALFFREYDGVWTMPTIDLSGTPNCTMVGAISYSKAGGETWAAPVCATAVDNTVASTGVDPAASGTTIDLATGDWFGAFCGVNGDAGTPTVPMTATVAGVTFGAATTRWNGSTSSGTDLRGHSIDQTYTSGTASAGPDGVFTLTTGGASGAGVMVFYRLRLAGGDATASPAVIARSFVMPAVTVSVGAAPAVIARSVTMPAPAVSVGAAPALMARVFDIPATTESVGVAPAVIARAFGIGQAAVSVGAAPAVIARAFTIPLPSVSVGIAPAVMALAFTMPPVTADGGAAGDATVSPATIALAFAIPQVTVDAEITLPDKPWKLLGGGSVIRSPQKYPNRRPGWS